MSWIDHVIVADGCWEWDGTKNQKGYGRVYSPAVGHDQMAHRVVFEAMREPIPEGLSIDHLCRNRGCVRPSHLEPVTAGENVLRGMSPNVLVYRSNICKRGHNLNRTRFRNANGVSRGCIKCQRIAEAQWHQAHPECKRNYKLRKASQLQSLSPATDLAPRGTRRVGGGSAS